MRNICTSVLFIVSIFSISSRADSRVLEAYGDSLTAGFLSNTDLTAPPNLDGVSQIMSDLVMYKMTSNPKYLEPHQKPELAWPQVLAGLLANEMGPLTVGNYAVSGAHTSDLLSQVQRAPVPPPD
jgi:hypothetical protein